MRPLKRAAAILYLLCCVFALGSFACSIVGPAQERMAYLLGLPAFRIALLAATGVIAIQALYVLGLVIVWRPEPRSVHPDANPDIEVTCPAIEKVARMAAVDDDDVLVESVRARVAGREAARVRIKVEAIALANEGLPGMAHRMQQRVQDACEAMLGCPGVHVRVRFLPSKTTTEIKEASDE